MTRPRPRWPVRVEPVVGGWEWGGCRGKKELVVFQVGTGARVAVTCLHGPGYRYL